MDTDVLKYIYMCKCDKHYWLTIVVFSKGGERILIRKKLRFLGFVWLSIWPPPENFSGANDIISMPCASCGNRVQVLPRVCLFYMLTNTTLHRLGFVNSYILIAFVVFLSRQ